MMIIEYIIYMYVQLGISTGSRYSCEYVQAGLTGGCWSLSRPSFVFTSCEDGTIQCWNLLAGGNSPIQKQNTSGAATVIIIIVCVLVIVSL